MSEPTPTKPPVKAVDIQVLRCLNPQCRGFLAYEVNSDNVLYIDLSWTAHSDGTLRWFPCPKCRGKNVLEEFRNDKGQTKHRVSRWQE